MYMNFEQPGIKEEKVEKRFPKTLRQALQTAFLVGFLGVALSPKAQAQNGEDRIILPGLSVPLEGVGADSSKKSTNTLERGFHLSPLKPDESVTPPTTPPPAAPLTPESVLIDRLGLKKEVKRKKESLSPKQKKKLQQEIKDFKRTTGEKPDYDILDITIERLQLEKEVQRKKESLSPEQKKKLQQEIEDFKEYTGKEPDIFGLNIMVDSIMGQSKEEEGQGALIN